MAAAPTATVVGGVDLAFDDLLVEIDAIAVVPDAVSAGKRGAQ
jgi:enamine deaminase RidA (YjgF/YER057c/UK114 family)